MSVANWDYWALISSPRQSITRVEHGPDDASPERDQSLSSGMRIKGALRLIARRSFRAALVGTLAGVFVHASSISASEVSVDEPPEQVRAAGESLNTDMSRAEVDAPIELSSGELDRGLEERERRLEDAYTEWQRSSVAIEEPVPEQPVENGSGKLELPPAPDDSGGEIAIEREAEESR